MQCLIASGFMILMITSESQEIFPHEAVICWFHLFNSCWCWITKIFNMLKMRSLQLKTSSADLSSTQPTKTQREIKSWHTRSECQASGANEASIDDIPSCIMIKTGGYLQNKRKGFFSVINRRVCPLGVAWATDLIEPSGVSKRVTPFAKPEAVAPWKAVRST